jgi:glucose/mannose-6-phosphate isomerase
MVFFSLDDTNQLKKIDVSGMLNILQRFPEDCFSAIQRASETPLGTMEKKSISNIIFAGVGGSSIGGKLIIDWLYPISKIPLMLSQHYHLPAFVNEKTLVFTVSYSGNTEETLNLFSDAQEKGASSIVFTSGGLLRELATEKKIPIVPFPRDYKPRAAIPFQFFSMAKVLQRLGFVDLYWDEVYETITVLKALRNEISIQVPLSDNLAKKVAKRLVNKMPLVYGSKLLEGTAYRLSTQFNENSKVPSAYGSFPEVFHNAIQGCEWTSNNLNHLSLLILNDIDDDFIDKKKIKRFKSLFSTRIGDIIQLDTRGSGRLARIFSLIYLGDYISTYLALLQGIDPSSNLSIDELKKA